MRLNFRLYFPGTSYNHTFTSHKNLGLRLTNNQFVVFLPKTYTILVLNRALG